MPKTIDKDVERARIKLENAKKEYQEAQNKVYWKRFFTAKFWGVFLLLILAISFLGGLIAGILEVEIFSTGYLTFLSGYLTFLWIVALIMFFVSLIFGVKIIKYIEEKQKEKKSRNRKKK